jgi:hypothetical protein
VEGAWAYRGTAKVGRHLQLRLEQRPKAIQDLSWKAQVSRCTRYRCLLAHGKHANQVVVAIARELVGFMWAIANQVAVTPSTGAQRALSAVGRSGLFGAASGRDVALTFLPYSSAPVPYLELGPSTSNPCLENRLCPPHFPRQASVLRVSGTVPVRTKRRNASQNSCVAVYIG